MSQTSVPKTRLAPSPTGALHLGNARTFLVNWALARQNGWRILLRMEDLDGPRIKPDAAEQALEALTWLGMDWDEGPVYQTDDLTPYEQALGQLIDAGKAYPCRCTRSQILAASVSAPHGGQHELRYPGTCRPAPNEQVDRSLLADPGVAWRLRTPDEAITIDDVFGGSSVFNPQQEVGDFLIATKGGQPIYQLSVVIDDHRQGVTQIVRGDDLLPSAARQAVVYRQLGLGPLPAYTHVPLVVGEDGRRLAKRHGDTRVLHYKQQRVPPERVIGLIASWCGVQPREAMCAEEFAQRFNLNGLPIEKVVFTAADDRWLLAGAASAQPE